MLATERRQAQPRSSRRPLGRARTWFTLPSRIRRPYRRVCSRHALPTGSDPRGCVVAMSDADTARIPESGFPGNSSCLVAQRLSVAWRARGPRLAVHGVPYDRGSGGLQILAADDVAVLARTLPLLFGSFGRSFLGSGSCVCWLIWPVQLFLLLPPLSPLIPQLLREDSHNCSFSWRWMCAKTLAWSPEPARIRGYCRNVPSAWQLDV